MTKARFEIGKTYRGRKASSHYFKADFTVLSTGSTVVFQMVGSKETFKLESKRNIEGEYCKLNKIVIRSCQEVK